MKALARRGFLKALGIAPGAAAAVGARLQQTMMGLDDVTGPMSGAVAPMADAPNQYLSVAQWWENCGEQAARERSQHVHSLDADLVEMRIPMATKARMQRARNYDRAKGDLLRDVARRLSLHGVIKWWS